MPNSEIDDIFAAKGKQKAVDPPEPPKASESFRKSKKKKGKRKRDLDEIEHISAVPEEKEPKRTKTLVKQRVPETVVDPSLAISSTQKSHKPAIKPSKKEGKGDDKDRFKDSRGTGSRRTTEDGFTIYKEDELGISGQGGDSPLCPFDCQCCF